MEIEFEKCDAYHDERGDLIQFVTDSFLKEKALPFGQIYLLTFDKKGVIRGNHYHNHSSEVFCLISGSVEIVCEHVESKDRMQRILEIEDNKFYKIFIGHKIAHAIRSLTDFAVMVSFSSEEYRASDDDKIAYKLL
jgi:dTDP-4-dehydrorhamnose 3,5-epimerase-like enzyme